MADLRAGAFGGGGGGIFEGACLLLLLAGAGAGFLDVLALLLLLTGLVWIAFRVTFLSLGFMLSRTGLTRPDLRRPSSVIMVVGPSASNFFHGGDSGFGLRE